MIQRFTYLGNVTIEHVRDGDSEEWNVYPQEPELPPAPEPGEAGFDATQVAAPLGDLPLCAAPVYTKKRRSLMGTIRAGWFVIFTGVGEGLTYALNNLTTLNLPPGTATITGAVLAGTKRALWPDTTL